MPSYEPPFLDREIRVQNPEDRPQIGEDDYGRELSPPETWGALVWASKRDRQPFTEFGEGAEIKGGESVFTIRNDILVSPDATIIDRDGTPYVLVGAPAVRGGRIGELATEYLEIYCERRTGQAV